MRTAQLMRPIPTQFALESLSLSTKCFWIATKIVTEPRRSEFVDRGRNWTVSVPKAVVMRSKTVGTPSMSTRFGVNPVLSLLTNTWIGRARLIEQNMKRRVSAFGVKGSISPVRPSTLSWKRVFCVTWMPTPATIASRKKNAALGLHASSPLPEPIRTEALRASPTFVDRVPGAALIHCRARVVDSCFARVLLLLRLERRLSCAD